MFESSSMRSMVDPFCRSLPSEPYSYLLTVPEGENVGGVQTNAREHVSDVTSGERGGRCETGARVSESQTLRRRGRPVVTFSPVGLSRQRSSFSTTARPVSPVWPAATHEHDQHPDAPDRKDDNRCVPSSDRVTEKVIGPGHQPSRWCLTMSRIRPMGRLVRSDDGRWACAA
jgi:hypothetical protein